MPSPSCNRFDVLAARNRCPPATRAPTQFDGPNLRDAVGAHRGLILIETNNRRLPQSRVRLRPQRFSSKPPLLGAHQRSMIAVRSFAVVMVISSYLSMMHCLYCRLQRAKNPTTWHVEAFLESGASW